MESVVTKITEHVAMLRSRIAAAARAAGRDPDCVNILAVSKRQPVEALRAAMTAGLDSFGENQVREALGKIPAMPDSVCWHFIGNIQSNKTRQIATHFDWAQTLCTPRIAERLNAQRPHHAARLQVCIQLRPMDAPNRPGADEADIETLAELVAGLPRLQLRGLMIIPLPGLEPERLRSEFRRTRQLMESLRQCHDSIDTLSMGMTADFELAIMEGSTMIRVGSGLFGPRPEATDRTGRHYDRENPSRP